MNKKDVLAKVRKIESRKNRRITATHHRNILILIESTVASGAEGDTFTDKGGFIGQIEFTTDSTSSEDDSFGLINLFFSDELIDRILKRQVEYGLIGNFETKRFDLRIEIIGKIGTRNFREGGIIFNKRRLKYLTTIGDGFKKKNGFVGAESIECGGHASWTSTNNCNIIDHNFIIASLF